MIHINKISLSNCRYVNEAFLKLKMSEVELMIFTCVAKGESRSRSVVTPSVPKSCHRNSSETTDPIIMKLGM